MTINGENNHHPYDKESPYSLLPNYVHHYEQPSSPYIGGALPLRYPPPPHLYPHFEQSPPPYIGGTPLLTPHVNHPHLGHCPGIYIPLCFFQGMHSYGLNSCCDENPPRSPAPCTTPHIDKHNSESHTLQQSPPENKLTVRVYTKAKTDYSLTIREGQVILAPTNPSDQYQHWIKDEKFGKNVKDEQGFSSFALINKATGQAMKHAIGVTYPVQLTEYNPERLDKSLLWTQGKSSGDGYRPVRAVDNVHFLLDACEGIKDLGGVHDGTKIILWEWNNGDNQRWTIASY